ncbi:MAG TPA: pantoate--beta-alanine ligase [Nocardioidaceae bacterium]
MNAPVIARTRSELARLVNGPGANGTGANGPGATGSGNGRTSIAFVPTMGALHHGHAALIDEARRRGEVVVVSIFVNPLQFAPGEDLERYPRTFDADVELCARHGADVVFAPAVDEVYPGGQPQVTVEPGALGTVLEGASRPGHFRGVLTVVAKLFGLVTPDVAVFGQKDYQQLVLVRRMVADLCMAVDVVGTETVREPDGLALSSRNRYLSPSERSSALALSMALRAGQAAGRGGPAAVRREAERVMDSSRGVDVDYLELTGEDLSPAPTAGPARLLVAARVGSTRLIDNMPVVLGTVG